MSLPPVSSPPVASNHQPAVENSNTLCGECSYLNQSGVAVNLLNEALKKGIESLQQRPAETTGWWNGLKKRFITRFVHSELDPQNIKKIHQTWDKCIYALNHQEGTLLHHSVRNLLNERKLHYRDFEATIPGLSNHDFKRALFHISAMGSFFKMIKYDYQRKAEGVRRNLTQGIRFLHKGGVSKDDASLKSFEQIFLKVADQIEIEASKEKSKAA